jgi:hypothetical protein
MTAEIVRLIERLNLSHHQSVVGASFPDIVALMSMVFGVSFLLFGWQHHRYFLGITGFLVGGWAGLMLKGHAAPSGNVAPFLYLAVCAIGGAYVAIYFQRFVGMLLGGFTIACLGSVFFPAMFNPGRETLTVVSLAFLLGGGLGGIFPKFFFVFNSSLIGAVFATYGVSLSILSPLSGGSSAQARVLLHLLVFLPLFLFGLLYQLITSQGQELPELSQDLEAPAPAVRPQPAHARAA